ncbi:MAG: hypothetical protein NT069_31655 [Planctomycetota bacterium]|nr:hypothetical protein [Planctomycetota bacterium]
MSHLARSVSRQPALVPGVPTGGSRRGFLRLGGLTLGGLALGGMGLPEILRAEASAGVGKSAKAVIMVLLPGGAESPRYVGSETRRAV